MCILCKSREQPLVTILGLGAVISLVDTPVLIALALFICGMAGYDHSR